MEKNEKLYFSDEISDEKCYSKSYLIDEMKERELLKIDVTLAIRELKSYYFYCRLNFEVMGKNDECCGKFCEDYRPRNGKSGCCKFWGFVYTPTNKKFILDINGKLTSLV